MHFANRIVVWQRDHGRHDLPWQKTTDPYRIWLSEIMLQQTQVTTVIGYYTRFLERFPDIATLACATQGEVMPYWAGLGYYARARNLHRCAQTLVEQWSGRFPPTAEQIATLPGIGPSTAAAIAAFAYDEQTPIMDGNVKRVFTRHFGIEGDPTRREVEQRLWTIARHEVDVDRVGSLDMPAYTQGLMDLGATLCTRRQPACDQCPVGHSCVARQQGRQHELPSARPRKVVGLRATAMLLIHSRDHVLLTLRPSPGIWGGLWSLPECAPGEEVEAAARMCSGSGASPAAMAAFEHVFTHFRLHIQPWHLDLGSVSPAPVTEPMRWFARSDLPALGLPAPVRKLVDGLLVQDIVGA